MHRGAKLPPSPWETLEILYEKEEVVRSQALEKSISGELD